MWWDVGARLFNRAAYFMAQHIGIFLQFKKTFESVQVAPTKSNHPDAQQDLIGPRYRYVNFLYGSFTNGG
jgi:hypothetical protein